MKDKSPGTQREREFTGTENAPNMSRDIDFCVHVRTGH